MALDFLLKTDKYSTLLKTPSISITHELLNEEIFTSSFSNNILVDEDLTFCALNHSGALKIKQANKYFIPKKLNRWDNLHLKLLRTTKVASVTSNPKSLGN